MASRAANRSSPARALKYDLDGSSNNYNNDIDADEVEIETEDADDYDDYYNKSYDVDDYDFGRRYSHETDVECDADEETNQLNNIMMATMDRPHNR